MTPSTIRHIIDSFLSSPPHVALYIEHVDITNSIETLMVYKKDIVFIELVETEGNAKEDYINNYLLKVELQSDTVIFIQPTNISSIQPLTKEQYDRVVELINKKHTKNNETEVDNEDDNSIELDIDLSETEVDNEDIQYNPEEAITYITTDVAKLAAHLSTPQVDQKINNTFEIYNNKMYNILKKLSKLFKPIKYNNNNISNNLPIKYNNNNIHTTGTQNNNLHNNNNNISNKLYNTTYPIQQNKNNDSSKQKYMELYKQIKLNSSNNNYQKELYNIIKEIYNIMNNISNITKKQIHKQLSNIIYKYDK